MVRTHCREALGRATWHTLHHVAALRSDSPRALLPMLDIIWDRYPCKMCRLHFRRLFRDRRYRGAAELFPNDAPGFSSWIHNTVSRALIPPKPAVRMDKRTFMVQYHTPYVITPHIPCASEIDIFVESCLRETLR